MYKIIERLRQYNRQQSILFEELPLAPNKIKAKEKNCTSEMGAKRGDQDYYLGFRFLSSLFKLFPLLYSSWQVAALLTGILFVAAGSYEYVNYHSGTIIGKFYNCLLMHDEKEFWKVFTKASFIYLGQTLLLALISLFSWLLALSFRKNLVTSLHKLYFSRKVFYSMNSTYHDGIDNPDQRITQDAEKMTSLLAKNILPYLIISPGVIAYYTYKTWTQAGAVGVGCIYGYFLIGSVVNRIIVSPITKWSARVEKSEGDFRYKHVTIRDNAEEAAFYEAENFEHAESSRFLTTLIQNQLKLALWKFPAQYFQNFFDYYGGVLTYAVQAIPIFALNLYKNDDPGTLAQQISNNAFFFMYLINSFTRLTDLAMNIGEMAGYTQRIAYLVDYSRRTENLRSDTVALNDNNDKDLLFSVENVACYPPNDHKRRVFGGISFDISASKHMLISGVSGVGKTTLLRLLKQLWAPCGGRLERYVSYNEVMFLPQNTYLPAGHLSLKNQIIFPSVPSETSADEMEIVRILESLSLSRLLPLCGNLDDPVDFEWNEMLSPGEQQRLSIARVLIRKPKVVILDEATSGLSDDMEGTVYDLLKKNGIFYVSVGHRSTLTAYHDVQLKIKGPDLFEVQELTTSEKL